MTRALLASVLALGLAAPALAQTQQAERGGGVRVGTIRCDVSGARSFVFGSTREVLCTYTPISGRVENYRGEIRRYGVDVGFVNSAVMIWGVLAPTSTSQPGVLAGTYAGVSAGASAWYGARANLLVGGSNNSFALQPLSVEGERGLNLALGVAELTLQPG